MTTHISPIRLNRRRVLGLMGASALLLPGTRIVAASQDLAPQVEPIEEMVIDVGAEPVTVVPSIAYAPVDWSLVHSIYDALVGFDRDGTLHGIAAETFQAVDEVTFEATLREGMFFHDGSPATSDAAVRGFEHLQAAESLAADLFSTVSSVEAVDNLTIRIICSEPSPWLPAQMAAWHVLLPDGYSTDSLSERPVGSGPYAFVEWQRGSEIVLERFAEYQPVPVKGTAIAERVRYHFVPDASTRVSNLLTGDTHLVTDVPFDLLTALAQADAEIVSEQLVGSAFIRIATDVEPFSDARVRQALNLGLDVEAFPGALIYEDSYRLASIHPGQASMGFDPVLAPYAYDPEAARALLEEAGVEDGTEVVLQMTTSTQQSVAESIAAQWGEIGLAVKLEVSDYATFNAGWTDTDAPPLRMATWSPLYDPHNLLSLVFHGEGALSRYDNPDATALIDAASIEAHPSRRAELYRELANLMFEDAAGVWLWNQVAVYGVSTDVPAWSPRPDEWVLPLVRG
jgi:peptide/nickel transport system substrate-binding protein